MAAGGFPALGRSLRGRSYLGPLLALAALLPLPSLAQQTVVNDTRSLLAALQDPAVERIVLTGNITLRPEEWRPPLLAAGRNVTLASPGSPNLTSADGPNYTGSATLDFSRLAPAITVGSNASLTLTGLVLAGLAPAGEAGAQATEGSDTRAEPCGLMLCPTVDAEPGAQVAMQNVLYLYPSSDCGAEAIQTRVQARWPLVGPSAANVMPPPNNLTFYVHGYRERAIPVAAAAGGEPVGYVQFSANDTAAECELVEWPGDSDAAAHSLDAGSSGSSGSGGVAGWVWVLVGLLSALAVATASLAVGWWGARRRWRRRLAEAAHLDGAPTVGELPLEELKVDEPATPQAGTSPRLGLLGLESTLRIRFGDLDQLELGELIGRGGYGRVYKARWRGAPAAVKVVEHSVRSVPSAPNSPGQVGHGVTPAPQKPHWESVLGTLLSHPNIVATHRVSTVQLRRSGPGGEAAAAGGSCSNSPCSPVGLPLGASPPLRTTPPAAAPAPAPAAVSGPAGVGTSLGEEGAAAVAAAAAAAAQRADRTGSAIVAAGPAAASGRSASISAAVPAVPAASAVASLESAASSRAFVREREGAVQLLETWMVLEYCDRGSLADAIRAKRFWSRQAGRPHLRAALLCLRDVACGMAHLHSHSVVHGDLKSANVLLKSREDGGKGYTCKIADFGLSRLMEAEQAQLLTQTCGTVGYMPPELLAHGQLSPATDSYSFGILMWELATCRFAFGSEPAAQVFYRVVHLGERPALLEGLELPAEYVDLMQRCWAADPGRPTFANILKELDGMVIALRQQKPPQRTGDAPAGV